jgi:hypothetical protein
MTQPVDIALLIVQQAGLVIAKLTPEQLDGLLQGRGQLAYHEGDVVVTAPRATKASGTKTPRPGVDIDAIVTAIRACATGAEVEDYLETNDRKLTVPTLKAVAKALGPTVVSTASRKADLKRNIVAGTAGFRERSDAMSAGAWRN